MAAEVVDRRDLFLLCLQSGAWHFSSVTFIEVELDG